MTKTIDLPVSTRSALRTLQLERAGRAPAGGWRGGGDTETLRRTYGRACCFPRLVMHGGTIIEDVLSVVGDDQSARSEVGNPYVDPAITDQETSHQFANTANGELVLETANVAVRHSPADARQPEPTPVTAAGRP